MNNTSIHSIGHNANFIKFACFTHICRKYNKFIIFNNNKIPSLKSQPRPTSHTNHQHLVLRAGSENQQETSEDEDTKGSSSGRSIHPCSQFQFQGFLLYQRCVFSSARRSNLRELRNYLPAPLPRFAAHRVPTSRTFWNCKYFTHYLSLTNTPWRKKGNLS